jgi:hypothetical protein
MMVMACAPFACVVDGIYLTAFGLWFVAVNQNASGNTFARLTTLERLS